MARVTVSRGTVSRLRACLPWLALLAVGCPGGPKEGPPPAESLEIASAAPHALGALAAGTDGAPAMNRTGPPSGDEGPGAPDDDDDAGAAPAPGPDAAIEAPEDVPL